MGGSDSLSMSFVTFGCEAMLTKSSSALSPTPPFPKETARMRLAGILVPAVAVALLTSSSMFMKMTTFFVGGGFFGDPIISRAYTVLNHEFPDWRKYLELRRWVAVCNALRVPLLTVT